MTRILAIDQGTTGSRAVIYDNRGRIKASAYREFKQYFPGPGWVEHDPVQIWQSVVHTVNEVLSKVDKGNIAAIGISNQRETTVVWDRRTGSPVYNAIVWQCRRTSSRCGRLKKIKGTTGFFSGKTGLPIDPYFSATKIEWILNNVPGARAKARAGRLCFGTTDAWLLWNLTKGGVHATDYTNASRTALFNINTLEWDKDILKMFNIPEGILPRVRSCSGVFGVSEKIGGLPSGVPISGIAGDQQAALFGQACFEPGTVKNTYGTGCFVLLNTGKRRICSREGLITTLGCGRGREPVYVLEGSIFVAGAAIQWLRDGLGILASAGQSETMAGRVKDNAGVYFVPALTGLGAPYWKPDARGGLFGLTRGTSKEHLVRAALESICYQTKDVLKAMEKDSGLKISSLKVDGGAAVNNFLCQFQADILGVKIIRPRIIEVTSLGAAYLAGLGAGIWKTKAEIKKYWERDRVFTRKISSESAGKLYRGWRKALNKILA